MERLWTGRNEKSNGRRLGRFGLDDVGGDEETAENVTETAAYEVVASPLGYLSAVEDMPSLGIDGGATNAGGKVGGCKDVEEKLTLQGLLLRDMRKRLLGRQ